MARLSCSILSDDESFRAQLSGVLRGSSLSLVSGDRAGASDVVVVDGRDDPDSAVAARRAAAIRRPDRRHLLRLVGRPARLDPAGHAGRRQRVLRLAARRARRWTKAVQRVASRRGVVGAAAGDDAGVLRRQGRRRHHDDGGELRRRSRAAEREAHGHRRPQAGPRRGVAFPRRAQPLHAARRARQPAPPRRRLPARSWWSSTSRASTCWPDPISSIGRPWRHPGARGGVPAAGAPVRIHRHRRRIADESRARCRRCTPPT